MAADALSILVLVFLPLSLLPEVKGDLCYRRSELIDRTIYCRYGCCGSDESYCCDVNVGAIVGGVIGGLAFIALVVTLVCCLAKKQGYHGRVVTVPPMSGSSNVTVIQSMQSMQTTGTSGVPNYPGMYMYSPPAGSSLPPPPPYSLHGGHNQGLAAPILPAYAFQNPYNTGATTAAFP